MIRCSELTKVYTSKRIPVHALRGVSFEIEAGDYIVVHGPSGSGKSTLLNLIGLLDEPTSGQILLEGSDVARFSERKRARIRNRQLGFVFQRFNLIPHLNAWRNVALPGECGGVPRRLRRERASKLLERVGLADRADHLPSELSGGEEQRVAIARALFMSPPLLLADEPTGNLDSKTGRQIMELLTRLNRELGMTVVLVTHDPGIAAYAGRTINILDGRIVDGKGAPDAAR